MMKTAPRIHFLCLLLLSLTVLLARPSRAQEVILFEGDLPLLISCPHGGSGELSNATVRQRRLSRDKRFSTKKDLVTQKLAHAYWSEFGKNFPGRKGVSLIKSQVHRKYVDLNRPEALGVQSGKALLAHRQYHYVLAEELKRLAKMYPRVYLLDIHGQSALELDLIIGTRRGQTVDDKTLETLWSKSGVLHRLEKLGFSTAPDEPQDKFRFSGGYITQHYGQEAKINAIQLEHGQSLRFDAKKNQRLIREFCEAFSPALHPLTKGWFL